MGVRGQFQLSFGMIFSIIVIVATISVAGYLIVNFIKFKDCTQINQFYENVQDQINTARNTDGTIKTIQPKIPSIVQEVCFGKTDQDTAGKDRERQVFIKEEYDENNNLFLYPIPEKCGRKISSFNLKYSKTDLFFCVPVKKSSINITLVKESPFEPLVTIKK